MKTDVIMIRKMGNLDVAQRISDGMFNATLLMQQWNHLTGQTKQMNDFIRLSQTQDFIDELKKDIESQTGISPDGDNQVVALIKGRMTKSGKTSDTSWHHPYLFIKFAMWLNSRFELQVIKFIHDQLIAFRHEAGDNFNGLTSAVQKFQNIDYQQLAKGLNWIVFGRHESGIRQQASQEQLKELVDLQKKLAFACDMGYIRTFDELINEMRRIYHNKHYRLIS
jgi:hypothetical protein